ncbi:MAG: NADH-quinone oxidoreductase subunit H, partial [Paramuribaculum sp.]|nr:NADH-quinone oxidoreductase subunit H [Paramuribaculum sp.]
MFDFSLLTEWIGNFLQETLGLPAWLATTVECVGVGLALLLVYSLLALFYIWYERKLCAAFQCRLGPDRVGQCGLLQILANMFKMLIKELI